MDVVQAVRDGKGSFGWAEVLSEFGGNKLYVRVFRDAMKFDGVEACTWDYKTLPPNHPDVGKVFDAVRLPASAHQLQQIADLLNCMLLTPKVIDLIWLQATIKFNAVVNVKGNIVAVSPTTDVHQAVEAALAKAGGDPGTGLISCVGKYWCLINELGNAAYTKFGKQTACNYGWCGTNASGPGVTPGVKCWQRPGFQHDDAHYDPSQTIRLMARHARLVRADGTEEWVDLHDIAKDPQLAGLIHHGPGTLNYLRQASVEPLEPLAAPGVITLPEVTIYGRVGREDDVS